MEQSSGRKRYLPEKRAEILKQHLLEKKTLPDVGDANGIHPTMYYRWLKELLSNATYAFEKGRNKECQEWKNRALELEKKLTRKNEVLSELMEEHVALKKSLGVK
ncbi:MAG: transposase [Acidobacteria bacterium]|nr:transposase [Acidobacteriota bacterium]MBI3655562.1 transposase [Acidobacteriota bacterium]